MYKKFGQLTAKLRVHSTLPATTLSDNSTALDLTTGTIVQEIHYLTVTILSKYALRERDKCNIHVGRGTSNTMEGLLFPTSFTAVTKMSKSSHEESVLVNL